MGSPDILHQDLTKEFHIDEGCFITELSNRAEDPDVSIARARVEPGQTTQWHYLTDCVERYVILNGAGRVEVGARAPTLVNPGDVVFIPAGVRQRITNVGADDLVFLAICSPRFRPEFYHAGQGSV